jgi:hypothetical protein
MGCPASLAWLCSEQLKQIGGFRFTGSQLTFFRFLKLEMLRLTFAQSTRAWINLRRDIHHFR